MAFMETQVLQLDVIIFKLLCTVSALTLIVRQILQVATTQHTMHVSQSWRCSTQGHMEIERLFNI